MSLILNFCHQLIRDEGHLGKKKKRKRKKEELYTDPNKISIRSYVPIGKKNTLCGCGPSGDHLGHQRSTQLFDTYYYLCSHVLIFTSSQHIQPLFTVGLNPKASMVKSPLNFLKRLDHGFG